MAMLDVTFGADWKGPTSGLAEVRDPFAGLPEASSAHGSLPASRGSWGSDGAASWDGCEIDGQSAGNKAQQDEHDATACGQKLTLQRDRNRQAQNRYRQKCRARKKEIASSHEQLIGELEAARLEHASLKLDTELLDKLLSVRDTYIGLLQLGQTDNGGLEPIVRCMEVQEPVLTPGQQVIVHCTCLQGQCPNWDPQAPLEPRDIEAFKALSMGELHQMWSRALTSVADLVAEVEAGVDGPLVMEQLRDAMITGRTLCWRIAHYQPGRFAEVAGISAPSFTAPAHWDALVADLKLSPRQLEDMVAVARALHHSLQSLHEERRGLAAVLAAVRLASATSLSRFAMDSLEARGHMAGLQASMSRELRVVGEATGAMFQILSNLQHAKLFTVSQPWLPDVVCVVEAAQRALGTASGVLRLLPGSQENMQALLGRWSTERGEEEEEEEEEECGSGPAAEGAGGACRRLAAETASVRADP